MVKVGIPHHCWYEDKPLALTLPDDWKVHRCRVANEGDKPMTEKQIKAAILNLPPEELHHEARPRAGDLDQELVRGGRGLRNHHEAGSKVAVIPDGTSCIPEKELVK